MERSHGISPPYNRKVDIRVGGPETYVVSFMRIFKLVECPVEGCPTRDNNPERIMERFMY